MAIVFPSSPTNGQVFSDPVTGNRYTYDSSKSLWKFSSNNVSMTVGAAPPPTTTVAPGAMWYNTNTGRTFILYDDGDSRQWVENVPAVGSFDSSTVAGYANAAVLPAVTPAYNTANAAFAKANTALQNTSGTFAGSLTATGDVTSGGTITALSTVQSSSGADLSLNANGANRDVIMKVNGTEIARLVGSTAKLGIGTDSPSSKLHVSNGDMTVSSSSGAGQFSITDTSDSGRGLVFKSNFGTSNTYIGTNTSIRNLILGIDSIERMRIDTSGRVTKPYQPSFFVRSGTAGGSGPGAGAVYVFTDVEHNIGSHYSTSTGRFTAPIAGRYLMMSGVLSRSGGGMNLLMMKNGSVIAYAEDSRSGGYGEANITVILNLSAGDYITMYPNNAAYGGQYDWFSGYLVG